MMDHFALEMSLVLVGGVLAAWTTVVMLSRKINNEEKASAYGDYPNEHINAHAAIQPASTWA